MRETYHEFIYTGLLPIEIGTRICIAFWWKSLFLEKACLAKSWESQFFGQGLNLHFFSCIRCLLRKLKLNHFESIIDMAYSLETLYSFRGCSLNSNFGSHIHLESTDRFSESLWIHYPFRKFTMNSLSASRSQWEFTISSRNHYEFTIDFANFH